MSDKLNTVFCIDDQEDILQILKLCLENVGGLDVLCSADPRTAIDEIERVAPDIVLLDVMMPDMDGPTTLALLQSKPWFQGTPVVFMTARAQPTEVDHFLSLGAAAVLTKPFDPMKISQQIEEIWEGAGHAE